MDMSLAQETLILAVVCTTIMVVVGAAIRVKWGNGILFNLIIWIDLLLLGLVLDAFIIGKIGMTWMTLGLGAILGTLGSVAMLVAIQRQVIGPVQALVKAAKQIERTELAGFVAATNALARGDLISDLVVETSLPPIQSGGEIGELAQALNQM
jgi:HAMP domain-containing protein